MVGFMMDFGNSGQDVRDFIDGRHDSYESSRN